MGFLGHPGPWLESQLMNILSCFVFLTGLQNRPDRVRGVETCGMKKFMLACATVIDLG